MSAPITFAILSDPHIALPHTIWSSPHRFHQVEISLAALEHVFSQLEALNLDFLLIPGDLTQHGELENHAWLAKRLQNLPYPVYVVPGNHDILHPEESKSLDKPLGEHCTSGIKDFTTYYQPFGYTDLARPYYCCEVSQGIWLIGLNSIYFDATGQQTNMGRIDDAQMAWLEDTLNSHQSETIWVMIHHNVIEHLPGQSQHILGQRYMLENAPELLALLKQAGVQLIFTGHLHVQDIAEWKGIYEITTGSLVSYPHPYRVLSYSPSSDGSAQLDVKTLWVEAVPGIENLQQRSRDWLGDRSFPFMVKLLTHPPLNVELDDAEAIAPQLRHFWADIAYGDAQFTFPELEPSVRAHMERFGAIDADGNYLGIDNQARLTLLP